ncbi:hypothetical protein CFP56_007510 [Quercus suber]|uniref:DUF4283 domain-containing protein n=1 Tax=Quercus suber TaxID=58331 RepID=A0AAW0L7U4_QUESU|nr:hypothetical protein CFP56_62974 [Quercus suber]
MKNTSTHPLEDTNNPENDFLKDNSRKKTYAEVVLDATMHELEGGEDKDVADEGSEDDAKRTSDREPMSEEQHRDEGDVNTKAWAITVTAEMKCKMARPWQTSVILKLMGKQLGYRALQSRLAGIWRPIGNMQFIDIAYGFYIMKFEALKDYHHALMRGPWFVGDQYLHVQAWEADFHSCTAKVTTTAVWIRLEQLPIEYYHLDFFKTCGY